MYNFLAMVRHDPRTVHGVEAVYQLRQFRLDVQQRTGVQSNLTVVPASVPATVTDEMVRVKSSSVKLVHVMYGLDQERRPGNRFHVASIPSAVSTESTAESATVATSHRRSNKKAGEEHGHLEKKKSIEREIFSGTLGFPLPTFTKRGGHRKKRKGRKFVVTSGTILFALRERDMR